MTYGRQAGSVWADTALWVTVIGAVCELIAFSARDWAKPRAPGGTHQLVEVGLWKLCDYERTASEQFYSCQNLVTYDSLAGWYRGTQAVIAIGFISCLLAFVFQAIYTCSNTFHQHTTVEALFVSFSFLCVVCNIIGLVVYSHFIGSERDLVEDVELKISWCVTLGAVTTSFIFVAGCLGVLEVLLNPRYVRFSGSAPDGTSEIGNPTGESSEA